MNARTAERRKFAVMAQLEKARLARMLARDAAAVEEEARQREQGELRAPVPPVNPKRGDFVQDRVLEKTAGAKKAWRARAPLVAAYEKGLLSGGSPAHTALERFEAGQNYACLWRVAEITGRDSTDLDRVMGGAAARDVPPRQMWAIRKLARIEEKLPVNDVRIIRAVCGYERKPSEIMREINPDYKDRVSARLCEALDSLVEVGRR
jgi:hypothetical protein